MADEAEVTVNNNSSFKLEQPFEASTTSTNTNTSTNTIELKPLSQTSTNTNTVELKPLSQTSTETIDLRPVKVDSRQEVAVTDPIRTDSSSVVDLRPLVVDVCQRSGPAPLPPTHVCQPYHHRIGLTLMGIEIFGLVLSGDNQTLVEDRPGGPFVAWGPVVSAPPPQHVPLPGEHHHASGVHGHEGGGGLRIRLTG